MIDTSEPYLKPVSVSCYLSTLLLIPFEVISLAVFSCAGHSQADGRHARAKADPLRQRSSPVQPDL
jgi:hypothetical protein